MRRLVASDILPCNRFPILNIVHGRRYPKVSANIAFFYKRKPPVLPGGRLFI
jgi:hypothetical protein